VDRAPGIDQADLRSQTRGMVIRVPDTLLTITVFKGGERGEQVRESEISHHVYPVKYSSGPAPGSQISNTKK
jgi:hypothetical protein